MKIKINMLFWDGGDKQRFLNTKIAWHYLKNFCDLTNDLNGTICQMECFLFDFSHDKVLDEAIHIPYPKGVYKRSEKINKVIEYHKSDEEYIFSVIDSDLVIKPKDYDDLNYLIANLTKDRFREKVFYVFNLDDLKNTKGIDFENKIIDFEKIETQQREMTPDMGAFFLISNKLIEGVGGFDIRFTVYGGEDNKLSYTLQRKGYKKSILPVKPLHLFHENLLKTVVNTKQYQEQVKLLEEK